MSERPLAAFDLLLFGHAYLEQMADGGGEHVAIPLEVFIVARESAERAGDVRRDGRFFGNDQAFGHRSLRSGEVEARARGGE